MTELPSGWRLAPLGDAGGPAARNPRPYQGTRPYLATADVDGYSRSPSELVSFASRPARANLELAEGDVLQAKMKGTNKAVRVTAAEVGWLASTGFALFSPMQTGADPGFIYFWLSSERFNRAKDSLCVGSTQQAVSDASLRCMLLAMPPVHEQRGIAAILDTLDEVVHKTEVLIAKLTQVKDGLLHDLLTRGVDESGGLRPRPDDAPHLYKDSLLGRIPEEWRVSHCESVCREITVGIVVRPVQYYVSSGIPILRSANVRERGLEMTDLVFMADHKHRAMQKSAVQPGDLVTVRTGYPGTTAVVPDSLVEANCVDLIISRPAQHIDSEYLATWINSDFGKGQVLRAQGGLAQQHFNVAEMKRLLVAVPPLPEQGRVSSALASHSRRLAEESIRAAELRLLGRGVVNDLLTGRVRVPVPEEVTA